MLDKNCTRKGLQMEKNNQIRIVIDTNLWISFLIGKRLIRVCSWISKPNIQIVASQDLIDEIFVVAQRDKFRKYFPSFVLEELKNWMEQNVEMVSMENKIPSRCRDPKDDYLLELAVQAKAIYLVSGDDDLLSIGHIDVCRIVTISQFEKEMENI